MPCPRCEKRVKDWEGDDPKCAFVNGYFTTENWNCATMGELRARMENPIWSEDQNLGVITDDGAFIVLSWYKSRGRTMIALELDGEDYRILKLSTAEDILKT